VRWFSLLRRVANEARSRIGRALRLRKRLPPRFLRAVWFPAITALPINLGAT
jgi:hypothetical protein